MMFDVWNCCTTYIVRVVYDVRRMKSLYDVHCTYIVRVVLRTRESVKYIANLIPNSLAM